MLLIIHHTYKQRSKKSKKPFKSPFAIIVEPSKELCYQATVVLKYLAYNLNLVVMDTSMMTREEISDSLASVCPHILITTPAKIVPHLADQSLVLKKLKFFIIDESDLLFSFGHKNEMLEIKK